MRLGSLRKRANVGAYTARALAPISNRGWAPFTRAVANTEQKAFDIAQATYNISTTGSVTLLAYPITGADYNARIGRKIKLKSLYVRGRVGLEAAFAGAQPIVAVAQQVRMMIVYDMQPNGVLASVTDILNTADPSSQLNLSNRERFKIVAERMWTFDPLIYTTAGGSVGYVAWNNTMRGVKLYQKMGFDMTFNAVNGGSIADIASGALLMVWIGSVAAGANTDTNFIGTTRVRYADY